MRKIIAILLSLILTVGMFPVFANASGALVINASVIGDAEYTSINGVNCIYLENSSDYLAVRASDNIAEKTDNVALRIVYLDNGSNYIRVRWRVRSTQIVGRTRLIHKSASGEMREALILINKGIYNGSGTYGEDILIDTYDTRNGRYSEYISEVELIDLSNMAANEENGKKKNILYKSTADLVEKMGLFPKKSPDEKASVSDINTYFEKVTGLKSNVTEPVMGNVLKEWLTVLGYSVNGDIKNRATEAGLIRSVGYSPAFYGRSQGREMQNFGIGTICFDVSQAVFNDDLSALIYNLLFMKRNGESKLFMTLLCEKDSAFKEKMLNLNDYLISNTYYDNAGIQISEKTITDALTGEKMTCLYMKGANINSTYINEFSSIDGENYVLCAAYDNRIGTGIPVIYNTKTKETVELSENGEISPFAMLMSKQNIAYWTQGDSLYSYNVETKEKKTVFTEPDRVVLQDVPTITNDGKYISVFCGKTVSYQPDTIYRINTENREYETVIDSQWVKENFGGSTNPLTGHVIINPENSQIINFMHGGGENVKDRLWFYDNGNIYQPYVQKMKEVDNNYFGEHITHAFWSLDGQRLYFLRPPASSDSVENGITYVDMNDDGNPKEAKVLNGDYSYIHTSVDAGDKHFISDTQIVFDKGKFRNEIVLYSDVSKRTKLLAYVPVWNAHPCHSHPTFTGDGKKVIFNLADEQTENSMVAVMDVESIMTEIDTQADTIHNSVAWKDTDKSWGLINIGAKENEILTVSGCECINVTDTLGIEVLGSVVKKSDGKITVALTYFDDGSEDFYIEYNTNSSSEYANVKNRKKLPITKTNTKEWKTQFITLSDASLRSANADNTDFKILKSNSEMLYIKNIAVYTGEGKNMFYSSGQNVKGTLYIPIVNNTDGDKTAMLLTDSDGKYTIETFKIKKDGFEIINIPQTNADRLFVWQENLVPIDRRNAQ